MSVDTILANMRKAAFDRRSTSIGGGLFTGTEIKELVDHVAKLEHNNQVLKNALWRASADDKACVDSYIESEGGLK